jgi:ATP-dependent helicase/nuclease subunit B
LERFVAAYPDVLPEDAEARLLDIGQRVFDREVLGDAVVALWWPRFCRVAGWFVAQEAVRRVPGGRVLAERKGVLDLDLGDARAVRLEGRIDRLDQAPDGSAEVLDYKTGTAPEAREVIAGLKPQLPLLGAIVGQGAVGELPALVVSRLLYLELKGAEPPGKVTDVAPDDPAGLIARTLAGVTAMLRTYADPAVPYVPVPRPRASPFQDPYAVLSRDQEWLDAEATS